MEQGRRQTGLGTTPISRRPVPQPTAHVSVTWIAVLGARRAPRDSQEQLPEVQRGQQRRLREQLRQPRCVAGPGALEADAELAPAVHHLLASRKHLRGMGGKENRRECILWGHGAKGFGGVSQDNRRPAGRGRSGMLAVLLRALTRPRARKGAAPRSARKECGRRRTPALTTRDAAGMRR